MKDNRNYPSLPTALLAKHIQEKQSFLLQIWAVQADSKAKSSIKKKKKV